MKNYSIKEKGQKKQSVYVKDFNIIENTKDNITTKNMKIVFSDGSTTIVPYNVNNLVKIRNMMMEQAKRAQELLPSKRYKKITYKLLTVAGATCVVLVNTTEFGKEINPIITNGIIGGFTLLSGCGALRNSQLLTDLRRLNLFVRHDQSINEEIVKNPYMYANINDREKELLETWMKEYPEGPLVIENIDKISYRTLKTIWNNIRLSRDLKLDYEQSTHTYKKTK